MYELLSPEGDLCGACYLCDDDEVREFGGILLSERARGQKLADLLCQIAIAFEYATHYDEPPSMIAHVHVKNQRPRSLLERLGFRDTGEKDPIPAGVDTGAMEKDENQQVVGNKFAFDWTRVKEYAAAIRKALDDGLIRFDLPPAEESRHELMDVLAILEASE